MTAIVHTGGCQCGAVRFRVEGALGDASVCHCRMCQKAVGGPFAVICPVDKVNFHVTRGTISWFKSSELANRGFCKECGTPLIFDYPWAPDIGVLAGAFDEPDRVPPIVQYGNESRVGWYAHIAELPGDTPTYSVDPEGRLGRISATNRQHPDHDTAEWPPRN